MGRALGLVAGTVGLLAIPAVALAQTSKRPDPYACAWFVNQEKVLANYEAEIEKRLGTPPGENQADFPFRTCILAELLKRTGDPRADEYFRMSIDLYPDEPAFDLFYADYLQFVRGVRGGLVVEADRHYLSAREKIAGLRAQGRWGAKNDERTRREVERGLLLLHRADGIPLSLSGEEPIAFFSTDNEVRRDTVTFDQFIDAREFASESLFAESPARLNRPLDKDELRAIAREKFGVRTKNRVRLRVGGIRAIDLTQSYQRVDDANIENFFSPTRFRDDVAHEYGIAISDDFTMANGLDLFLGGSGAWGRRTTSAEFFGEEKEDTERYRVEAGLSRLIGAGKLAVETSVGYLAFDPGFDEESFTTYTGRAIYQSKLFGLNRFVFDGTFVYQDIEEGVSSAPNRNQRAFILRGGYQFPLLHEGVLGAIKSGEVFASYVDDVERVGSVDVDDREISGGLTLRGIDVTEALNPFDVTLRSSYFTSSVEDDPTQDQALWRNQVTLGYRLVDHEAVQWLPTGHDRIEPAFINLEVPLRNDTAVDGPSDFENSRIGLRLRGEFFHTGASRPFSFFVTVGYDFQRFHNLDENLHLFVARVGTGF